METQDKHVGFHEEAPGEVVWSSETWIRPVHPGEQFSLRGFSTFLVVVSLGLPALAGLLLLLTLTVFKEIDAAILIPLAVMMAGMTLSYSQQRLLKRAIFRRIRSRAEALFVPGPDCIAVGIEDAFTYDKHKLSADDFGLLKITPEAVYLEMTRHRARFDAADLRASLLHTAKNLAGVRLTCNRTPLWSVVLTPLGIGPTANPVKQSEKVLRMFEEAGIGRAALREEPVALAAVLDETPAEDEFLPTASVLPEELFFLD
jgi:hypothetical protein